MKNLRQYMGAATLALTTAGCMTPEISPRNLTLAGQDYSGIKRTEQGKFLVQKNTSNVRYTATSRGVTEDKDVMNTYSALENAVEDSTNQRVRSITVKLSSESLEDLRTGKRNLAEVLGVTNVPGMGRIRTIVYNNQTFILAFNQNTRLDWRADGNGSAIVTGDYFEIGKSLTQEQFDTIVNPPKVTPVAPKAKTKKVEDLSVLGINSQ